MQECSLVILIAAKFSLSEKKSPTSRLAISQ